MKHALTAFSFLFLAASASAGNDDATTFGPEFEFTNAEIAASTDLSAESAWADRLTDRIAEKCPRLRCEIKRHRGKFGAQENRVVFEDGYWFNISIDPKCVEIQARPQTLEQLKAGAERLNEALFASAREIGLETSPKRAGHFNIGILSAFGADTDHFLKFFVDYATHAELASGILRENWRTAPPLAALSPEQHASLDKILADRRRGKLTTVKAAIERIVRTVYTANLAPSSTESPSHNQAINLDAATEHAFPRQDRQMEIRAVRSQASAEEFILLAELFSARIRHLKSQPLPERFVATPISEASWPEKIESFRRYVAESGIDPDRFMRLVPHAPPWPRQCIDLFF